MTAPSTSQKQLTTCFSQVVVPIDFSPLSWRVLVQADRLARAFGVPRKVVHIDTSSPWVDEGAHELTLRTAPSGGSVEVTVVAARTPVDGIVRALGDDEGALLVMSTHGHAAATEIAVGSTAEEMLRRWRGPMVLAGPNYRVAPVPFRRLVLCVDPDSTVVCSELVEDVAAWAATFHLPVEVLAVVDPTPPEDLELVLRQNERLEGVVETLSASDLVVRQVRLEGTRPGQDIARYVNAVDGTLVALATHARTPSARFVLGSTAVSVLRHTTSPVLVRRFTMR